MQNKDLFLLKMILKKRQMNAQIMPQVFKIDRVTVTGRAIVTIFVLNVPS